LSYKCIHFCSKCILLCLNINSLFPTTNHIMHAAACVRLVSMFRAAGRCVCFISRRVLDWLLDSAYNIHTAVYCRRDHPFSLIYIITEKKSPSLLIHILQWKRVPSSLNKTECIRMPSDIVPSHPKLRATSAGPMKYQGFPHA